MAESETQAIVIDNGSGLCKAGYGGEQDPVTVFPNILGTLKRHSYVGHGSIGMNNYLIGKAAQAKRGMLTLHYPIEYCHIYSFEIMELIWDHVFSEELHVDPGNHPVLLTEPSSNPLEKRETLMEIMFEKFNVPASYLADQASLALYASGLLTGLVYESGDGGTQIVPIYEGYALKNNSTRCYVAGRAITDNLIHIMMEQNYKFTTTAEVEIARDIKESLCYVALDFNEEMHKAASSTCLEKTYELPDGQILKINNERFRSTEILFEPKVLGGEFGGIQDYIYWNINKCDIDIKRELFGNILLSGGSSKFPGLAQRIEKEVGQFVPASVDINIIPSSEGTLSVWRGGSILASQPSFQTMWVTRGDYNEHGRKIVHSRCLL